MKCVSLLFVFVILVYSLFSDFLKKLIDKLDNLPIIQKRNYKFKRREQLCLVRSLEYRWIILKNKNPNCILNALIFSGDENLKSSGLGRDFSPAHDGRHVRGIEEKEGTIITLAPLTGTVVYRTLGSSEDPNKLKGNRIIDIKLDKHPYIAIYKDLLEWKATKGQHLREGMVIGTVLSGRTSASGFHFTLIKQQFYKRYREITGLKVSLAEKDGILSEELGKLDKIIKRVTLSGNEKQLEKYKITLKRLETQLEEVNKNYDSLQKESKDNFDKWFIDPIGAESPVNCPGAGRVLTQTRRKLIQKGYL